jgi:hypothetical protein
MNIDFNYKIVNVVKENNFMEVEYSAEGHETVLVGVTIPRKDVNIEDHIKSFAPYYIWVVSKIDFHDVLVGQTGTIKKVKEIDDSFETNVNGVNNGISLSISNITEEMITSLVYKIIDEIESSKV